MKNAKPWMAHIEEKINNLIDLDPSSRVRCSMFRVPPSVRKLKPHLYNPQIIPFGLYSLERIQNDRLSAMEKLKLEVASVVLRILRAPYTECYHHYDAALDCLNLSRITPHQLHPILSELVSSLSRLPHVSRDSEGKLDMMRGRIAGLKAMGQAPGYELREREVKLLAADLDSCFKVFVGFLGRSTSDSDGKDWKWFCNKVVGDVPVMDLYDDVPDMYDGAASSLLTLDAIFLVGFMLSLHAGFSAESKIRIEELGWFSPVLDVFREEQVRCNIHVIAFDMWLMENQIPLTMIRNALGCLWEVSNHAAVSPAGTEKVLSTLVKHAVKPMLHLVPGDSSKHSTSLDAVPVSECKHLLEYLYRVVCPSVKIRSSTSSSQQKATRKLNHFRESSNPETAATRGDAMKKTKTTSRSQSSSGLESGLKNFGNIDHPILAPSPSFPKCPVFFPGHSLYPPRSSPPFPGFPSSPPSSPDQGKPSDHSPSSLTRPQSPLPVSSNGSSYLLDSSVEDSIRGKHSMELMNGNHEPARWDDSHSPVNTDDELEVPFRTVHRSSSPLPVSDTMNMDDDGLDHVQYTLSSSRSRNNSYATVTIDIPPSLVGKFGSRAELDSSVQNGYVPIMAKLRSASMKTFQSVRSAGHWLGSPSRLLRKLLARRAYERKISFVGMYGTKGATTFRDLDVHGLSKLPTATCPMSGMRILPVPSVTQMRKAGIRCRSGSQVGCKPLLGEGEGLGVFRPTLFLPKLLIDENTERILQNLVAYELVSASEHELMSFLLFMNDLVKKEEDVQMLKQGEKAVLWLTSPVNDFEVISMFGNLVQSCHFTETLRSKEFRRQLTHCYSQSWRHWLYAVIGTVRSRSGILILLVAATFILVALQTVYLLVSYYKSIV
ncbi:hypothetical protein R1flu_004514 [Riccia fluitans]|uniref:VPS28 C-terminal domain-containing protein n=1 Tax=Riccia fluitans TaxID=41844 RepID=A0ABD1YQI3_9MARC